MTLDESGGDDSGSSAIEEGSGDDRDLEAAPGTQSKRKASSPPPAEHTVKHAKKTPARASTSTSTPTPNRSKSKPLKGGLDFESLAKAEEATRQHELDLAKEKVRYDLQKVRAKADIKMQHEKNAFELQRLELQFRQELLMEQMRLRTSSSTPTHHSQFSNSGGDMFSSPSPSFFSGPSTSRAPSSAPADLANGFAHMDNGGGFASGRSSGEVQASTTGDVFCPVGPVLEDYSTDVTMNE